MGITFARKTIIGFIIPPFLAIASVSAQTTGATILTKRNIVLVVPTPAPNAPAPASPLLTRKTAFPGKTSAQRINTLKPPSKSSYFPSNLSHRSANHHPYSQKFMDNASHALASTAPTRGSAAFAAQLGQSK